MEISNLLWTPPVVLQVEILNKIALLGGECQQLRAMVRKWLDRRLWQMRDKVEQQQPSKSEEAFMIMIVWQRVYSIMDYVLVFFILEL
jgi:hypothetical protein